MSNLVFISHSHLDRAIVTALVDYLESALDLKPDEIRCTSIPGYDLSFGASTVEQLKEDVQKSIGVIVILTPASLSSKWVLFELGASWALGKIVVPILGPGLSPTDLPGPLATYPCIQVDSNEAAAMLAAAMQQLARSLRIKERTGAAPQRRLGEFLGLCRESLARTAAKLPGVAALGQILDFEGPVSISRSLFHMGGREFVRYSDSRVEVLIREKVRSISTRDEPYFNLNTPETNLVVIGSPRFNKWAEKIQQYFALPYQYVYSSYDEDPAKRDLAIITEYGDDLLASRDRKRFKTDFEVDYGILFFALLENNRRVIWLSGIHGAATEGAFTFLEENAIRLAEKLPTEPGTGMAYLLRVQYEPSEKFKIRRVEQLGDTRRVVSRPTTEHARGLICDFGNVIMYFDRSRTYRALAHVLNVDFRVVQQMIEGSDLRTRYECGEIEDKVFCEQLLVLLGVGSDRIPIDYVKEFWGDIFWQNRQMFEALKIVKRQVDCLVLLSNTNHLHFSRVRKDYPEIDSLFDESILSYIERRLKPAMGLFHKAVQVCHDASMMRTQDILYVDDEEAYVDAAAKLGMKGFVFRSYPHFVFWLRMQGIYVP